MATSGEEQTVVMVFGVFDIVHPGHLYFLERAKELGTHLIVVVARDSRVIKQKGSAPMMGEQERLSVINALKIVDEATLGDGDTPTVIMRLKPDVIAVGHDQDEGHPMLLAQLSSLEKMPRIVKLPPHNREQFRSSQYKTKL